MPTPVAPRALVPASADPLGVIRDRRRLAMVPDVATGDRDVFAALATLAAGTLRAPRALVSILTGDHQVVLAAHGYESVPDPQPIALTVCAHTIATSEPLLLGDLEEGRQLDEQVPALLHAAAWGVRAYAGASLTVTGERVGTICVTDDRPRAWTIQDAQRLQSLAELGAHLLSTP